MKTNITIASTLIMVALSSSTLHAQGPNGAQQLQINVMPFPLKEPNVIGGPNLMGNPNINVSFDNNNNDIIVTKIDNGTPINTPVAINVTPALSNVVTTTVAKPAVAKPVTTSVVKPTVAKPVAPVVKPVAINNTRTAAPQQSTSRGAAPVKTTVPQRSVPTQSTNYRGAAPSTTSIAQRSVPAPTPKPVTPNIPIQRSVPAPAPIASRGIPAVEVQPEVQLYASNEAIEIPVQESRNYSNIEIDNVSIEEKSRGNSFEMPKIEVQLPSVELPKIETEKEEVVKVNKGEATSTEKGSNEREFSMPSVSFKGKSATAKRVKISAPKKGNKNYYTQKYSSKISFRVRFTQTKKALKSAVKVTPKKKVKIAPKVCFTF